jgi:hypothetical protein
VSQETLLRLKIGLTHLMHLTLFTKLNISLPKKEQKFSFIDKNQINNAKWYNGGNGVFENNSNGV